MFSFLYNYFFGRTPKTDEIYVSLNSIKENNPFYLKVVFINWEYGILYYRSWLPDLNKFSETHMYNLTDFLRDYEFKFKNDEEFQKRDFIK